MYIQFIMIEGSEISSLGYFYAQPKSAPSPSPYVCSSSAWGNVESDQRFFSMVLLSIGGGFILSFLLAYSVEDP